MNKRKRKKEIQMNTRKNKRGKRIMSVLLTIILAVTLLMDIPEGEMHIAYVTGRNLHEKK